MGQGASFVRDDIQTTHAYTTSQRGTNLANPTNPARPTSPEMVCESCNANFHIFNRKVSQSADSCHLICLFLFVYSFWEPGSSLDTTDKQRETGSIYACKSFPHSLTCPEIVTMYGNKKLQ